MTLLGVIFVGIPLSIFSVSLLPGRSIVKEILSFLTILAFFQMLGQFYWSRLNQSLKKKMKTIRFIKIHKFIGYGMIFILFIHPFLLVVPRFFEGGVDPFDALLKILTTFESLGVILGMIAWGTMLILGVTALIRKQLPFDYKSWRWLHGILALVFMITASWHVIDLGRHSNLAMTMMILVLGSSGVMMLMKVYRAELIKKRKGYNECRKS